MKAETNIPKKPFETLQYCPEDIVSNTKILLNIYSILPVITVSGKKKSKTPKNIFKEFNW